MTDEREQSLTHLVGRFSWSACAARPVVIGHRGDSQLQRGAVVIATIFSIIGSFQLFNEPNILKPLAPNTITTFFTPNMYAYNLSFAGQQYNYAATVAIIMGVITAVIAYVVQLRGSRQEAR